MFRRRQKLPVLAQVPGRQGQRKRPGSLDRTELDAYRGLLRELDGARVVLVSGFEGKSTAALGLATAAVSEGRATVLVECDLARPVLASTLRLDEAPGLAEYLRHEAEAPEVLQSLILAGPAAGRTAAPLVSVTAGAATSHGPMLLASEGFRHVAEKLRGAYELVVLSGPPLDDAYSLRVIAAQADRTLACCAASEVPKGLRESVDGLVVPVEPS